MQELRELSEYASGLRLEEIPSEVVSAAKFCVLDSLGAAVGAASYGIIPPIVEEFLQWSDSTPQRGASIWGQNRKTSLFQAVLLNGIMAHPLELDDVHTKSKTHIGAVVVPAAWTLADAQGSTGKEFLEAVIAGYEVMSRIGAGFGVASHRLKGWHVTGTAGTFGAAAAAARLLGLNEEKTLFAFGMAGTQSSGLWAFLEDGATSKILHTGRAAVNGITAALLAKAGMTGPEHILDAKDGGLYRATSDAYDLRFVSKELGKKYEIMYMDKKPYPSCRSTHPPIDAMLRIKKRTGLDPDNVVSIKVDTYEVGFKQCGTSKYPQNAVEAKFSIPYTVAAALLDGEVLLNQFMADKIADPLLKAFAEKVRVYPSERFTNLYPNQWGCMVMVTMADGTVYTEKVIDPSGSVGNPLSQEQQIDKFLSLVTPVLGMEKTDRLMHSILQIEELSSIGNLL